MKPAEFLQKIFFKQKKEGLAEDSSKFIVLFIASGTTIYFLLSLTGKFFHEAAAHSTQLVARNFFEVKVATENHFPHLVGSANGVFFDAQINDLCAGWLELAVMAGLVLASRDKPLKERAKGILLGALVLLLLNPIRIGLTLAAVGTPFLALAHDVLFRLLLVVVLVVFYALWYYWR